MRTSWIIYILLVAVIICCRKSKTVPSSAPIVTTVGITELTDSSVKIGGKITSNGNSDITAAGFCWSTVNNNPQITDDSSVAFTTSDAFVGVLKNLEASTTYYIRAYAINGIGTGYGDVVSFTTVNAAPKITAVHVSGHTIVDSTLTATYTYKDFENDPDSATTFQWYSSADTSSNQNELPVADAHTSMYTVSIADTLLYLRVGVTPFASRGSSPGNVVKSAWFGPVPKPQ